MKNKMLIWMFVMLTLLVGVSAQIDDSTFISYWTQDNNQTVGNISVDSVDIPNGNNGTLTDGVTSGITGFVNQAYDFESADIEFVDWGDNSDFDFGVTNWTVIGLIRPESFPAATSTWFSKHDSALSDANGWGIIMGATGDVTFFRFDAGGGTRQQSTTETLTVGAWSCLAVTTNFDNEVDIYFNGTEATYDTTYTDWASLTNTRNFTLGALGTSVRPLDADIDESAIIDRYMTSTEINSVCEAWINGTQFPFTPVIVVSGPSLTQVEIQPSNANQSSNLTGNSTYTNDDNRTTVIEKVSDFNIINFGALETPGEFGQAFEFDGIDDYLNFTTPDTFQNTTLTEMSWTWWMNSTGQSADAKAINRKWSEPDDERSWFIETQGATGDGVRIRLSANGITSAQTLDTAFFINDGEWHYYTITFNGSLVGNNLMFYVDGTLNSNATNSRTNLFSNVGVPILLGESEDLVDAFDGALDEVRIWKIALTEEEINETMIDNASAALTDLILYMDFDFARANITGNWFRNDVLNQTDTPLINVRNNTMFNSSFFCPAFACVDNDLINITINATDYFVNSTQVTDQVRINDTGFVNVSAFEKVSGLQLNTFNISTPRVLGTITGNITFAQEVNGTVNVAGTVPGYLNTVINNTETAVFNSTIQIVLPGFYSSNITLNVTDLLNGTVITGFNWTVNSVNFSFTESDNSSIINLINGTFNITIQHPNYLDNVTTFVVNTSALQLDIQLFVRNSFNITIRYEIGNNLVDDRNVTLSLVSSVEAFNFTTSNGTLFVSMIEPSIVDIRYQSVGFRERSFFFNLEDKSLNNVTLYMLDNVNGTLIIVTNVDETGAPVSGVTMQLLRGFIEDNIEEFKVVEMDITDFAGEAVITAVQNDVRYIIRTVTNVSSNEILFLSEPFEITGITLRITLDLLPDPLASFNTWRDITFTGPTFTATSDNITGNWTATYNDVPGLINPGGIVCLVVEEAIGIDRIEFSRSCSSSTIATLTVEYTGTRGTFASIIADTNTENSIYVIQVAENLFTVRTRISAALGGSGAFWSAAIIYSVSTMLIFNPATMMYGVIGGLISVWFLGFVSGGFVGFIALIIMGGIITFKLRT